MISAVEHQESSSLICFEEAGRRWSELFDSAVEIWKKIPAWKKVGQTAGQETASDYVDVADSLDRQLKDNPFAVVSLAEYTTLILIDLSAELEANFAAALVTRLNVAQVCQKLLLAQNARQQAEKKTEYQNEQLELYASQVSADFEELSWLRNLTNQLECCTVEQSLEEFAEGTLPMLRELIQARCISLVHRIPRNNQPPELIFRHWGKTVLEADCRKVIEQYQLEAKSRPVVLNCVSVYKKCDLLPESLRNIILTPIQKNGYLFGWLLAVDKQISFDERHHLNDNMHPDSFREFGTSEASLLQSSANLLGTHAKNLALFQQQQDLLVGVVKAMMNSLDARDEYTCGHSDRVAQYARIIAQKLGLTAEECQQIYVAGLVHDIGKLGVPDTILNKQGRLTDEEFAVIKMHPAVGYGVLKHLKALAYVLPGVLHHHEAVDGTGYPQQLKGDDIPLMARILAVADTFDALTSNRPYRDGMPVRKAIGILQEGSGKQWDTRCINAFMDSLDEILIMITEAETHKTKTLAQVNEQNSEADTVESAVMAVSRL